MSPLQALLSNAQSGDSNIRPAAERQLKEAESTQFNFYCIELTKELARTSDANVFCQQFAGILLKNAISGPKGSQDDVIRRAKWTSGLDAEQRNLIKLTLAQLLLADGVDSSIKTAAGQVVAKIARVEIPGGSWPELFQFLESALQSTSAAAKVAACWTLGYIADDADLLEQESGKDVMTDDAKKLMLSQLMTGMVDADPAVQLAALKGFYHGVVYATDFMNNPIDRQKIFHVLGALLNSAVEAVELAAWEVLLQIVSLHYDCLDDYMPTLVERSIVKLQGSSEQFASVAMEFWSTVCDEELVRMDAGEAHKDFVKTHKARLLPVLFACTAKTEENEEDPDDWNLGMAAGGCVNLCGQLLKGDIVEPALQFVGENFGSEQWEKRDAALVVYGSILRGAPSEVINPILRSSFHGLCKALHDPHPAVRDSAAWTLGRAAKFHYDALVPQINELVSELVIGRMEDVPRVARQACYALYEIFSRYKELPPEKAAVINKDFTSLAEWLITVSKRKDADEWQLKEAAFHTLDALIRLAGPSSISGVQVLVSEVLTWLEQSFGEEEKASRNQALIVGLLNQMLTKVSEARTTLNQEAQKRLAGVLLQTLKVGTVQEPNGGYLQWGPATEESILAIAALIRAIGPHGINICTEFVPILVWAIEHYDDLRVTMIAVEVVPDLVNQGGHFSMFVPHICKSLLTVLKDRAAPMELKPRILMSLGDLALLATTEFAPFISEFLQSLRHAASAKRTEDSEEWVKYMAELRDSTLSAYASIVWCIQECARGDLASGRAALAPELPLVLAFINDVVADKKSTVSNVCGAIKVVEDVLGLFAGGAEAILPQISAICTAIAASPQHRDAQEVQQEAADLDKILRTYRR